MHRVHPPSTYIHIQYTYYICLYCTVSLHDSKMKSCNNYLTQQAHYHSVTGALTTAQQEISQYLANTEQLNAQITHLQSQVAAVVSEREGALEQATQLSSSIQELEQKVQGLEAQKDQLEEDRFTAQTALQQLQSQHEQVIGSKTAGFHFEIGGSKRGH